MARKRDREKEEAPGFTGQQGRPRLTPVDVQQKVFRLAFRGYNERDVDEFLDQVTEDLAALHEENKRLREGLQDAGPGTPESVKAAQRQAEGILSRAREQAARLSGSGAGGGGTGSATYLLEERKFLQRIASLVQEHAAWLKDEARRSRSAPSPPKRSPRQQPVPVAPPVGAKGGSTRPSTVDEPTAAWSPESEPAGPGEEKDPLVSAWESAWSPEDRPGTAPTAKAKRPEGDEGEPSLRELFWGEE